MAGRIWEAGTVRGLPVELGGEPGDAEAEDCAASSMYSRGPRVMRAQPKSKVQVR